MENNLILNSETQSDMNTGSRNPYSSLRETVKWNYCEGVAKSSANNLDLQTCRNPTGLYLEAHDTLNLKLECRTGLIIKITLLLLHNWNKQQGIWKISSWQQFPQSKGATIWREIRRKFWGIIKLFHIILHRNFAWDTVSVEINSQHSSQGIILKIKKIHPPLFNSAADLLQNSLTSFVL